MLVETEDAYTTLLGKPEGKRPPERPSRRWENHIGMDFHHTMTGEEEREDWNNLAQSREKLRALVNMVMKFLAP